ASMVWLVILTICVLLYKLWWRPTEEARQERQEQEIVEATSSSHSYQHTIKLGLDGFSGYALLRSPELISQLRAASIKLETVDDGANYAERINALADGRLQMAAFPIDALITAAANRKTMPATIIALIDETRGADAVLAYKERYPNIDSLNPPDTRFVLVGGSPSETLFRVLLHDFRLDKVSPRSIVSVASGDEVLKRYQAAQPGGNEVFVTWEPYVSQLKANEAVSVLLDTSRQSGYIVDALVVSRDFLIKNEPVVKQMLEAYFRVLYATNNSNKLIELVESDAKSIGAPLTKAQATDLVKGIQWKNTSENLAHFGLVSAPVPHVEDMIDRIKRVLTDTKAFGPDAQEIDATKLFTERALRSLSESGFHPGVTKEEVRGGTTLPQLSDEQWLKLVPVGTLSSPPLVFARGRATLTEASQLVLDELVDKLASWPAYYVKVVGNAGSIGDPEVNRQLANQRAAAAVEYLTAKGVSIQRIKPVNGDGAGEMSVNFVFGQMPY
ncbi:MAG: OmpA family protein, partial [Pirellulaceae bacterium]|nr:OmpA family protein [Pirellulaceae bacterium]